MASDQRDGGGDAGRPGESLAPLRTASEVAMAILSAKSRSMTDEQTKVMLNLIVAGDKYAIPDIKELPLGLRIAKSRTMACGVPTTDAALVMITALCDRPGNIVMYCAVLKTLADRLGRAATISDICDAFPIGFPGDTEMTTIWDRQKNHDGHGSDNWLDRAEAWQS